MSCDRQPQARAGLDALGQLGHDDRAAEVEQAVALVALEDAPDERRARRQLEVRKQSRAAGPR